MLIFTRSEYNYNSVLRSNWEKWGNLLTECAQTNFVFTLRWFVLKRAAWIQWPSFIRLVSKMSQTLEPVCTWPVPLYAHLSVAENKHDLNDTPHYYHLMSLQAVDTKYCKKTTKKNTCVGVELDGFYLRILKMLYILLLLCCRFEVSRSKFFFSNYFLMWPNTTCKRSVKSAP